jgi:hypothetical protein
VPALTSALEIYAAIIEELMTIAWWDWDRCTLEQRFGDFSDLERFLENYG